MAIRENGQKDAVLQQIRHISDFPAMAETIRHFQDLKGSEDQNITEIANIILKDYALTTKLLKVVNSVGYLPFGTVTTISRAIFLLGISQIREITLTLMILDHLQKKGSQILGLETINQAFFSGFLARNLVRDLRFIEEEEGFICALLHPLGRILTAFALPEAFLEIKKISQESGTVENIIAREVLGISFEEIGTTIAAEWHFPSAIIQSMRHIRPREITGHPGENEKLGLLATLVTEITTALTGDSDHVEKLAVIKNILKGYEGQIPIMGKLEDLISATARDWQKLAQDLNINISPSSFSRQMIQWSEMSGESEGAIKAMGFEAESVKRIDTILEQEEPKDAETIFSKGIQEISNFMMQAYALNDVIHITLETIHRGMNASQIQKTLFLVRDTQKALMKIRFGFGEGIEEAKGWFVIECGGGEDIFSLALTKSTDLVIQDLQDPKIKGLIPSWYRRNIFSPLYVILLPITVNQKNIGLICLEGAQKGFKNIARGHLNYLKILRDQIILAITRVSPKN